MSFLSSSKTPSLMTKLDRTRSIFVGFKSIHVLSIGKSSQRSVLTKSWSQFVKEKKNLRASDVVSFSRSDGHDQHLYIGWKLRIRIGFRNGSDFDIIQSVSPESSRNDVVGNQRVTHHFTKSTTLYKKTYKKMGESTDNISDLPQSIIENILTRLSLRDAIRTTVLSTRWRFKWSTLADLVLDEKCVAPATDRGVVENNLVRFITGVLLLHQGPIHKFHLSTSFLQCRPDIDQWLLFLSRNGIKELVLELGEGEFMVPSCLFSCLKLTRLELIKK